GDLFSEVELTAEEFARMDEVVTVVAGRHVSLPRPERLGDVAFMYLEDFGDGPGETAVVLVRRRGFRESLRGLLSRETPEVAEWTVEPEDWFLVED
ncbi:MAG TPA: hypothetical protein VFR81_25045, partial [Longimicrobium sp.]|nr:hypothetical protein [Longimicrobium sp.]